MYKLVFTSMACAGALAAQTTITAPAAPGAKAPVMIQDFRYAELGPIGITGALAGPTTDMAGAPYSATVETQRVQILGDGNRIEQTTTGTVARDSQGRVRRDEALPALEGNQNETPHLIFIEDPVSKVHWTLDPRTKTAMKMPFGPFKITSDTVKPVRGEAGLVAMGPGMPPPPPATGGDRVFFTSSALPPKADIRMMRLTTDTDPQAAKTDLGVQTIQGVKAQGTRITRTIPAGQIGNVQPIVITSETWYSPELKVLVMSKVNDPRMGETTYQLTGLQRADPAPSLFEVPADYTVKEGPQTISFQALPKTAK
jgi:hypothetical protein